MGTDTEEKIADLLNRVAELERKLNEQVKVIEAETFRVVDSNGTVHATLGFEWMGGHQEHVSLDFRPGAHDLCH